MANMGAQRIVELLQHLSSTQNKDRQQAETVYQQAKASEPDALVEGLLGVLAGTVPGTIEALKVQAAVLLRQLVSQGADKDFVFARMQLERRLPVATELLRIFEAETEPKTQRKVGEVISKLAETACHELDTRGEVVPGQKGWPDLLPFAFRMANPGTNANAGSCEEALRLLRDVVCVMVNEVVAKQQELGGVLQAALAHPEPKIRCAASILVLEIVKVVEKKDWAPLRATAPVITQVVQQLAHAQLFRELEELLQQLEDVAKTEPDFFKQQLTGGSLEPAATLAQLAKARGQVEDGVRTLALEWLVTYVESRPKWLAKTLPALPALVCERCMELMLEIEDGESQLKEWIERMDDEEGEEDSDGVFQMAEGALDRVVEAMGMDSVGAALLPLIAASASQEAWQAKHAALAAIKQTIEYVEDTSHINEMSALLVQHVDHMHPRVRYTALHALGQMGSDQAPHFQEAWHQRLMPVLLRKMDDTVDRVASMAMSAFVSFGGDLDNALMLDYSQNFMRKLVGKLQTTTHRMVLEESITSIAVIASAIEKDFSFYYDGMMPLLKQYIMKATTEKESRLRGKAFECVSLLGQAVGPEKFLPDARDAITEMAKTPAEADDLQREYIVEAFERICKCLKGEFAPFLPSLLPGIYQGLRLDTEERAEALGKTKGDGDDEYITVSVGDGKLVKVRTSAFQEILQSIQLLNTFCEHTEGQFFDYVPKTAEALLPLLEVSDEVGLLAQDARGAVYSTWAFLIACARKGAEARGQPKTLAQELLCTYLVKMSNLLKQEVDPEALREIADGIAECLKSAGPGAISGQELLNLVELLFGLIDESLLRSSQEENKKKNDSASTPVDLQDDDDEDNDEEQDEEACRRSCEDAIGSVMEVAPTEFLQCLPVCTEKMTQWLSIKFNRVPALFLGCDMLKHLKEKSEPCWPVLFPGVFRALHDKDPDVRTPAAYAISLAAPLPNFAQAAPQAFRDLAQIVGGPTPKKRDEDAKIAFDNAVSALCALAKDKADVCPPEVHTWQLVVSKLPLRSDEDEAKKVHGTVVDLLLMQHTGLLGPDGSHLGPILSCLAEVYSSEELSTKEVDQKILQVFKSIGSDRILSVQSSLNEKQQKKIEKMLSTTS